MSGLRAGMEAKSKLIEEGEERLELITRGLSVDPDPGTEGSLLINRLLCYSIMGKGKTQ